MQGYERYTGFTPRTAAQGGRPHYPTGSISGLEDLLEPLSPEQMQGVRRRTHRCHAVLLRWSGQTPVQGARADTWPSFLQAEVVLDGPGFGRDLQKEFQEAAGAVVSSGIAAGAKAIERDPATSLPPLPPRRTAERPVAEQQEMEELPPQVPGRHLLLRSLVSGFGRRYLLLGLLKACNDGLNFSGPVLLHELVRYLQTPDDSRPKHGIRSWPHYGLLLASSMGLAALLKALLNTQYTYRSGIISVQVRSALCGVVFRKSLLLQIGAEQGGWTAGEVQTLMSVDADRVTNLVVSCHELWALPAQILLALYLLYTQVGCSLGRHVSICMSDPCLCSTPAPHACRSASLSLPAWRSSCS